MQNITLQEFIINEKKPKEEWKEIANTNGKYYISSFGRIISMCAGKPYFLSPWYDEISGYYRITIRINGKIKKPYVHGLVAQYFIEKKESQQRLVVHHKNGKKTDNHAENLIFLTAKEHNEIHRKEKKGIIQNA